MTRFIKEVPGALDVLGLANASAVVTVNGNSTYRKGEYFDYALAIGNTSAAQWQSVTVSGSNGGNTNSVTGNVFLPQTPESFSYDLDGNLTQDGRWNYTWDAENRIVRIDARSGIAPVQRIDYEYDWQGRRIGKNVWINTNVGTPALSVKFLNDGWNLIAELDGSNAMLRSYLWGNDLSGSLQGAGGVGGLIAVETATNGVHFAAFDGNGNVAGLVDASSGAVSALYEYGPFGETIRATGPLAKANPIRWSTKYQDDETDLVYYGYRYLSTSTGRWVSRDPRGEVSYKRNRSGLRRLNLLYAVCENDLVDHIDFLGLRVIGASCDPEDVKRFEAGLAEMCKKALTPKSGCCNFVPNIQSRLKKICDGTFVIVLNCKNASDDDCKDQSTCASTSPGWEDSGVINICPIAWTAKCAGGNIGCVALHEALHGAGIKLDPSENMQAIEKCVGCPESYKNAK